MTQIRIDTVNTEPLSELIFGHNLEHTRAAVSGGLSAQMLRNRKFAGKPSPEGVASDWEGIGDRAFFQTRTDSYTRHEDGCDMPRRNELQNVTVQNLRGGAAGIKQAGLFLTEGREYEFRVTVKSAAAATLTARLADRDGQNVYAETGFRVEPGDWQSFRCVMKSAGTDSDAAISLTYTELTTLAFGAVSLLPADNFHGMRRDVVDLLKEISPTVLRWPGGNFAGEYRWKDGLLPSDMRGPLESLMEDETQTYTHGYDLHEINTDDFVALCREVGAQPFITINAMWCSPAESAEWVEYCNGGADTEYGKKRAERGHPEPYGVRFWSLGNEMGYGHMEGPHTAADYADLARSHAEAMLKADPTLKLSSSGPYPNDDWARDSAAALAPVSQIVSLHHYADGEMIYTPGDAEKSFASVTGATRGALDLAERMRKSLDRFAPGSLISFDEWNVWYSWFRPSAVTEGIFTAIMLNMFINRSRDLGIALAAYFQPVNEGAIEVSPGSARLSADGQAFVLAAEHRGGRRCAAEGADEFTAAATVKDGAVYVTLVNDSFGEERGFVLTGADGEARAEALVSDGVGPYTYFDKKELPVVREPGAFRVTLPPHSVAAVRIAIDK